MAKTTPRGTNGPGRRGISPLGWALRGAAAGAAASTALNAVTYLDMAVRGRDSSSTPEQTVAKLAEKAHVSIPGDDRTRENRLQGLGPLGGLVPGVGVGVLAGLLRAAGFRSSKPVGTLLTTACALVVANGPMTVLRITDPRQWSAADWLSDVVPHVAYGVVVKTTMDAFDHPEVCRHRYLYLRIRAENARIGTYAWVSASRSRRRRRAPARRGRRACA